MNLEDSKKILQENMVSCNEILNYRFAFTTPESGTIDAYDNSLEVHIKAEWKFEFYDDETYIVIKGFEGLSLGVSGLVVKVTDVKRILVQQESAYDLVGE